MLPIALIRSLLLPAILSIATLAHAQTIHFQVVTPGIYAHIGDMGARSVDNQGLNANIGLVLTQDGAVLIDSGATYESAKALHEAVKKITSLPLRWVINTGGQDHRWLGNAYFIEQGAQLIAHTANKADMLARSGDQIATLKQLLGEKAKGTQAQLPTRWIDKDDQTLNIGGIDFSFSHKGGAHTPGDMLVFLPQSRVMFSGDVVYVNRMLGVIPVSNTRSWLATFAQLEALAPQRIGPGHGNITDVAQAGRETRDLLSALRSHMKTAVDEGQDISLAVRSFPSEPFVHLLNAKDLLPGNANRTYLEVERE